MHPQKQRRGLLLTLAAILTGATLLAGVGIYVTLKSVETVSSSTSDTSISQPDSQAPVETIAPPSVENSAQSNTTTTEIKPAPNFKNKPGKNLGGVNWQGKNLRGMNLSKVNLGGANLKNADLSGVDLSGANLSGANLNSANFRNANLRNADLRGANLGDANLQQANLNGALLDGANLNGTVM
ncbi:MAG: pentapeptide repeat-containing protein, partial [Rivularia sp. (in: cyanobacteria)]